MTHDEMIEAVARAIADVTDFDGDRMASRYADSELRDVARAAIRVTAPAVLEEAASECDKWANQYREAHKNAQARKRRQEARDFESMAMASAFRAYEIRALKTRYEQ